MVIWIFCSLHPVAEAHRLRDHRSDGRSVNLASASSAGSSLTVFHAIGRSCAVAIHTRSALYLQQVDNQQRRHQENRTHHHRGVVKCYLRQSIISFTEIRPCYQLARFFFFSIICHTHQGIDIRSTNIPQEPRSARNHTILTSGSRSGKPHHLAIVGCSARNGGESFNHRCRQRHQRNEYRPGVFQTATVHCLHRIHKSAS